MFLIFRVLHSNVLDNKCQKQVVHGILCTHETSGSCAGVCVCVCVCPQ